MILLTLRDLRFRLVRFVVVVVLGAVVFALLFVMTGLVEQFNREPFDTRRRDSARRRGCSPRVCTGRSPRSSTMPADTVGAVVADAVAPVVTARSSITADGVSPRR